MRLLFILLIVVGLWLIWVLSSSIKQLAPATRQRLRWWALGGVVTVLLAGVLLRFGVSWLAVAGTALLAFLGRAVPALMRVFSLAQLWRNFRGSGASFGNGRVPPHARGGSSGFGGRAPNSGSSAPPRSSRMSRQEALQILGLNESASRAEILAEYRRLIKRMHPDQGGSAYFSSQLNQAKEVLLG